VEEQQQYPDIWKCGQCGTAFKKNAEYKRHMMRHLHEKQHQCSKCTESFNVEVFCFFVLLFCCFVDYCGIFG